MAHNNTSTIIREVGNTLSINSTIFRRVIISSLLLTLVLSSFYNQQLKNQFKSFRALSQAQDERLLRSHINQSDQQLSQLSNTVSLLNTTNQAVQLADSGKLYEAFNKHWAELQETQGVTFTGFYDLDGNPLALWPQKNSDKGFLQQISQWVNRVKQSDTQLTALNCHQICSRYLISPLKYKQLKFGYLVVALPMSETLNQFNLTENRETGFLTAALNRETSTDILVFKWGYTLNDLSASNINKSVVQEFAKTFPDIEDNRQVFNATVDQHPYELGLYPLKLSDDGLLIVLDDFTENFTQILLNTFLFALVTFFIAVPIQWLAVVSLKNSFSKPHKLTVETTLEPVSDPYNTDDYLPEPIKLEIEQPTLPAVLGLPNENELLLNDKFELLKQYNEDINLSLTRQMIHLSHERDMVSNILDNSQSIILRLFEDGTIVSINHFGELISGFSSEELQGKNFTELYPEKTPLALKDLATLAEISQGHKKVFQHEAKLNRKDGKECTILWLHTKLDNENNAETQILTTGLDITKHKELENKLSWLVNHDTLTSLFNRRRFENELDSALGWAKKQQADGILLLIDLDNFKDINDSCGHKVGDIILRKVATTLLELTRQLDTSANAITARLVGDEFAIVLRGIDEQAAGLFAERIIKALNNITHIKRHVSFRLSSNIGIATFSIAGNNSTELLSNANYARNEAKIDGRDQFHIFKAEHSNH